MKRFQIGLLPSKIARLPFVLLVAILFIRGVQGSGAVQLEVNAHFVSNIDHVPFISWRVTEAPPAYIQSAFQIQVFEGPEREACWDSGKIKTTTTVNHKLSGIQLRSGKTYYYRVKVWNEQGRANRWSAKHQFTAPISYPEDWSGNWITYDYDRKAPLPLFRKKFALEKTAVRARLYISAPGFYEAYLNGNRIGENVLDPGQTNYEDYAYYTAYDIPTSWLRDENVVGVMLGNGWYNQNEVWKGDKEEVSRMAYGQPTFIAELRVEFEDGSEEVISTDHTWAWRSGPITYSNIYGGETYDSRLEVDDWLAYSSADAGWQPAGQADVHPNNLFEQFAEPIRRMKEVAVATIRKSENGVYIFDFGQNFTGWARLKISSPKGRRIKIRFAEELDSLGRLDPTSTGVKATKVVQTSTYICKGEGVEQWEPRFTYHGFRYAEVSGLDQLPDKDMLTGVVVYSSFSKAGSLETSEVNINKLHELADWTLIGNAQGIPTDCPHRERCGWTGDAHALAKSLLYNYDARKFLTKYMLDMRSSAREEKRELYFGKNFLDRSVALKPKGIPTMIVPGRRTSGIASPDWGTAMVQIPWYIYLFSGDSHLLETFYPDMKTWTDYIHKKNVDGIIPHGLGDWCPPGGNANIDCAVPVSSSAFHILDVKILSKVAGILEKKEDEQYYSRQLDTLIKAFNDAFYDFENHTYGSQTADAMAVDIGIVPADHRSKVAESIVRNIHEKYNGFINTGIFGLGRIFQVLCENGQEAEAYRILSKKEGVSFATMWNHYDATTLWEVLPVDEAYDAQALNGASHSHPMQSGFDAWFYSGIAGIQPHENKPGFEHIVLKPYLTRYLKEAKATHDSPYGVVSSAWKSTAHTFDWEIRIPYGATAAVWLPLPVEWEHIKVNQRQVEAEYRDGDFVYLGEFRGGVHRISAQP